MLDAAAAAYALLLGIVAAFNPCGFALLPAYITVIATGTAESDATRAVAARRALAFALAMTVGFMVVFTAFGLLFGAVNAGLQASILPYVSYVTVALGILVVALGFVLLIRGELSGPGLRFGSRAPRGTFASQVVYGASFAVASLSCTIGLFLAVVSQALVATNPAAAIAPFVIYALGMGTSVVAVSLIAAFAGAGAASALRRRTPMLMRVGGVIMVLAGIYVTVFGLAEILPQFGITALDSVLTTTSRWQGSVATAIDSWGTPVLIVIAVVTALAATWVSLAGRRR